LPGFFASKKYKKTSTESGPAIGVQLDRGHVNLCKERKLEPREWQAELDPLEDGGVHEEEEFFGACAIVNEYGFTFLTRLDRHVCVVFPPEDAKFLIGLAFLIGFYVFDGANFGGFI